MTLVVGAF